jgi:hypothetical protein
VIIGPHGVFAIETKTPSKPKGGIVVYDGESVAVGQYRSDKPVIQARAAARSVQEILRKMTGHEPRVTPVLLYVNWFVEIYTQDKSLIVMNQNYFFLSFDRLQDCNTLSSDRVAQLSAAMERYLGEKTK